MVVADDDAAAEKARAADALETVAADLEARGAKAGGEAKDVLEAQAMMAGDPALAADIVKRIGEGRSAERAVFEAFESFRVLLTSMGGYLGERAADGSGIICMAIVGGAIVPAITGIVADEAGLRTALAVPAACYATIAAFGIYCWRQENTPR